MSEPVSSQVAPKGPTLVARCENREPDGVRCLGRLRFRWGMSQAACDTCGAWCGIAVAEWVGVEGASSEADPDPRDVIIDAVRALVAEAEGPHGDYTIRSYEVREALGPITPNPTSPEGMS